MNLIPLSQGMFAIVDADDFVWLSVYKWHVYKSTNGKYYASRNTSRKSAEGKYSMKMHRIIMGLKKGDGKFIDHINGDSLDNRKQNLRIVTNQQNTFNRSAQRNNKSGYKGVYKHSQYDKWVAQIKHGDKRYHIGVFDTAELAAMAYDEYSKQVHGEHGYRNGK